MINDKPEIMAALLKGGADANFRGKYGVTPLMRAAEYNNPDVIYVLIKADAKVNDHDDIYKTTPLMSAHMTSHPEIITLLIKAGASVNEKDTEGKTPLIYAAEWSLVLPETITRLLEGGADPKIKDNDGKTALDYAEKNEKLKGTAALAALKGTVAPAELKQQDKSASELKTNAKDNAEMIWVPGGTFTMGSADEVGDINELPAHQVTLTGYWIYKYDVTVAQYRAFCTATKRVLPKFPGNEKSWKGKTGWNDSALKKHPIVNVTWNDAKAYADWAKVALPTEAQWEYAARGPRGNNYPWGGTATKDSKFNGWEETKSANLENSGDKGKSTWPVGSFPAGASWCGAQDMAGNVEQWCGDWYGEYTAAAVTNPTGPATGKYRVLRGGLYDFSGIFSRSAVRKYFFPDKYINNYFGFRCVSLSPGP